MPAKLHNYSDNHAKHDQKNHDDLCRSVYPDGFFHVGRRQRTVVGADIGLVEQLSEVIVGTAETTVKNPSHGCFGVAAIGTGMVATIAPDELYE